MKVKNDTLQAATKLAESEEMRATRARTYAGQANFAIGPRTCRECVHWGADRKQAARFTNGVLKRAPCDRYTQLMGFTGRSIPPDALQCKYFSENPQPPELWKR